MDKNEGLYLVNRENILPKPNFSCSKINKERLIKKPGSKTVATEIICDNTASHTI